MDIELKNLHRSLYSSPLSTPLSHKREENQPFSIIAHRTDGLLVDPWSDFCPFNFIFYSKHNPIPLPSEPHLDVTTFLSLRHHSDTTTLIDATFGRHVSFPAIWSSVAALASTLCSHLSVRKGNIVLLLSPNSIHFPVVSLVVMFFNAVLTTTNTLNTHQEIAKHIINSNLILAFAIRPLIGKLLDDRNFPIVLLKGIVGDDARIRYTIEELMAMEPDRQGWWEPVSQDDDPDHYLLVQVGGRRPARYVHLHHPDVPGLCPGGCSLNSFTSLAHACAH